MVMKLYRWRSETFASYGKGDIIVMATSIMDARRKALRAGEEKMQEDMWLDEESFSELKSKLFNDLYGPHETVFSGVVIIHGSE